ncbi:MAG: VWA domain-containing protein, partial [Acidimicrobiales bacterium]
VVDGDGDGDGTFAVTVVPPAGEAGSRPPLDVAVVLDRSGSMAGWKMVAARRAAARIVDALTAADRFVVTAFDDRIERPDRLGADLVPATDHNRFAAVEFLSRLEARGGTDVHAALEDASARLPQGGVLVLVTDGQVAQEDYVLKRMKPYLPTVKVFTVGIDQAVNAGFLNRLADASGGRSELVESEDRLDEAMARIHRAVTPPVLEAVELQAEGVASGTLTPVRPPDVFAGAPTVISGRGRPDRITLTARRPDSSTWTETVVPHAVTNPAVRTVWARAHVRDLEDRYAVDGNEARANTIVAVSLTYGVLSRFTAFVAIDPSDPTGSTTPRPVVQPVESPAMWPVAKLTSFQPMAGSPASMLAGAAPPPPPPKVPPEDRLRDLLDRLDSIDRDELLDELDEIADELPDGDLYDAVIALAEAVRSAPDDVAAKADDLRQLLGPDRARQPFWT